MITRLKRWLALWRWRREFAAQVDMPWPVPPDDRPEPSVDDAAALRAFLQGPVGTRLVEALRRMEYDCALAAAIRPQPQGRNYAAGFAAGSRNMAAYFLTLSVARPADEQNADDADDGVESLRARYTP